MKIRDGNAVINGDKTEHELPSGGLEIIADDGRSTLFSVNLRKDGTLRIDAGTYCKHGGKILEDRILIKPEASNVVSIIRPEYKPTKIKKNERK